MTYSHAEIMTLGEMYDRELSSPFYRDEDLDEVMFVRWETRTNHTGQEIVDEIAWQPLDKLVELLTQLEDLFQ